MTRELPVMFPSARHRRCFASDFIGPSLETRGRLCASALFVLGKELCPSAPRECRECAHCRRALRNSLRGHVVSAPLGCLFHFSLGPLPASEECTSISPPGARKKSPGSTAAKARRKGSPVAPISVAPMSGPSGGRPCRRAECASCA